MSDYKATLMKLLPNMNKIVKYKDLSIQEIIALKPEATISVIILNKYIRRLSGLFN